MKKTELRKLQLNLLETLKFIDDFCRKHKIRYYVIYGSLIGVARHKGFIPWDDDLDIAMPKEDYDKFCKMFQKEKTGKYFLQTKETDKNYTLDFAKIRNVNTTLIENNEQIEQNIVLGTYVDIFPLIGVPNNVLLKKIQKINRALYFNTEKNMINNKILKNIANFFIKIIGKKKIKNICYKNMMKYSCINSNNWFSCFGGLYEGNIHPKEWYSEPIYLEFENITVPVPKEYDKVLKKTYGNYMELPPVEERVWKHHPIIIDFEHNYEELL